VLCFGYCIYACDRKKRGVVVGGQTRVRRSRCHECHHSQRHLQQQGASFVRRDLSRLVVVTGLPSFLLRCQYSTLTVMFRMFEGTLHEHDPKMLPEIEGSQMRPTVLLRHDAGPCHNRLLSAQRTRELEHPHTQLIHFDPLDPRSKARTTGRVTRDSIDRSAKQGIHRRESPGLGEGPTPTDSLGLRSALMERPGSRLTVNGDESGGFSLSHGTCVETDIHFLELCELIDGCFGSCWARFGSFCVCA
jgi:hypothetical protein